MAVADGVLLSVLPFGGVVVVVMQAGVAVVACPFPRFGEVGAAEVALPEAHPVAEVHAREVRGAEEMHVIRHQQIVADHPRVGFLPSGEQGLMGVGLGEPRLVVFGANSEAINGSNSVSRKHFACGPRAISGECGGISHACNMTHLGRLREGLGAFFVTRIFTD